MLARALIILVMLCGLGLVLAASGCESGYPNYPYYGSDDYYYDYGYWPDEGYRDFDRDHDRFEHGERGEHRGHDRDGGGTGHESHEGSGHHR